MMSVYRTKLLLNFYYFKESKERFGSDEDFKKKAYSCVVRLQSGDDEIVAAWKLICNVSRRG